MGKTPKQRPTRKCHWVSQSYLRAFAVPDDDKRIWRLGREESEAELKRIDKVAIRNHLYVPRDSEGRRDDAMERKLSDLEQFFGDKVWHAVCNDFPDYSWEPLRKMVALLTAVSWLRTPLQFEMWKSVHQQFVDFYSGLDRLPDRVTLGGQTITLNHSSWPEFRDAGEDEMKKAWNSWLGAASEVAKELMKMRWAVVVSDEPLFITSDNPVLIGDTLTHHRGLAHPDTMVSFPLSPTRMLVMDNRHSEPDAQFYPVNDAAASNNLLTWRNAINYIFSHKHPDIVCGELVRDAEHQGFAVG